MYDENPESFFPNRKQVKQELYLPKTKEIPNDDNHSRNTAVNQVSRELR
jgi:hypothetical protein